MAFLPAFAPSQYKPLTAKLFASVPLPVKITSIAAHPAALAIASRASSNSLRTERPVLCKLEAFPVFNICAVNASIAGCTIGVVAA